MVAESESERRVSQITVIIKSILTRKSSGGHQAKEEERKKPKLEEQEGTPQHHHCPLASYCYLFRIIHKLKYYGKRTPRRGEKKTKMKSGSTKGS
jgi:hypothetical protein